MKYSISFDIDFKRNTSSGSYIALEGIDGSGKTTQVDRLCAYFESQGRQVVKTREPRKNVGVIGELIQKILNGKTKIPPVAFQYLFTADRESQGRQVGKTREPRKNVGVIGELIQKILHGKTKIPPVAFQYLFTADREIHHEKLILPSLAQGKTVISDRCFWSAVPYGILDRDGDLDENTAQYLLVAQSILSMYHQFKIPDKTFYLDIPLDTAVERINQGNGEDEIYEDRKKLSKILKGYNWLLKKFPDEFTVVDGSKPVEEVTDEIIRSI